MNKTSGYPETCPDIAGIKNKTGQIPDKSFRNHQPDIFQLIYLESCESAINCTTDLSKLITAFRA